MPRGRNTTEDWALQGEAFKIGYTAALEDVDRTGLQPKTSETRSYCADEAWKRYEALRVQMAESLSLFGSPVPTAKGCWWRLRRHEWRWESPPGGTGWCGRVCIRCGASTGPISPYAS